MRRGVLIFLLINVLIIGFLVRSVFTLLTLLMEDASFDAIPLSDLPPPNSTIVDAGSQLIPKIIHQTYINDSIPAHWVEPQRSCIDLHPDYEYKVGPSPWIVRREV
jgi:mannosyltransferase OCH1-like enzyme